jgi:hypothetical protein
MASVGAADYRVAAMSQRPVTSEDLRKLADAIREIGAAMTEMGVSDAVAKRIRSARYLVAELATRDHVEESGFLEGPKTEASGMFTLPPLPEDEWK